MSKADSSDEGRYDNAQDKHESDENFARSSRFALNKKIDDLH